MSSRMSPFKDRKRLSSVSGSTLICFGLDLTFINKTKFNKYSSSLLAEEKSTF